MVSPNPASPEAPPAVWSAVRALAHGHHFAGAEGLPQEHGEGALDVQDGGGPLGERGWVHPGLYHDTQRHPMDSFNLLVTFKNYSTNCHILCIFLL